MEQELGVTLLRRNNRGVYPTEIGKVVLDKAIDILRLVDEIHDVTNKFGNIGVVNISTIPCICDYVLPFTLNEMRQVNSQFSVSITTGESHTILNNVSSGISTLGIMFYTDRITQYPDLKFTRLFSDQHLVYVGPKSPLYTKEHITLSEIFDQPYIAYREEFLKDTGGVVSTLEAKQQLHVDFRVDELEPLKKIISQTDHIAFFPAFMSINDIHLQHNYIKALPIIDTPMTVDVGYIESTKYKTSNVDKLFIASLVQSIALIKNKNNT